MPVGCKARGAKRDVLRRKPKDILWDNSSGNIGCDTAKSLPEARTNISTISGFVEVKSSSLEPESNFRPREIITQIQNSAYRLTRTLKIPLSVGFLI